MERNVIGHTDHDFIPGETADHYKRQDDEVIRTGRSVEIEELIHTRDGDRNFLLIKFPLLDQGNHIFGIGGIATDITERAHYQQELISARKAAEEAEQMQEQFLANMSHEIRTPMNGIQGMTNLLLDTALTDQQKEFANIIRTSSGNLLVIINDILDFSKIKAGKLTLEKVDFKLKDILENVKGVLEHRIRKKGLEFRSEIDPRIPAALRGDPFRLNQILLNLVGNAIKFTDHGQILVKISQQDHTDKGVTLLFSVADTGIGISEGDLPHIFDSFSQAGLDITRRYGGTGLGLAICSQLVSLQQGGIRAESREGIGSKFEFWLHYDHSTDPEQEQVVAGNILDHRAALKGRRFLVAEDNEVNQKLIEYVLKKAGAIVTIARNGQEAIDELNRTSDYDIVIMDLQMPVMDGYEATRHIREEMKNPIPIVAMTATALKGEQLRCLEAGMNAYMTKPFEFTDMYKCMAGQLTKRSAAGPDLHDRIKVDDGKLYDLSLLQEMDDNEYLLDILQTFLSNTPGQVKEMRTAANIRDFETVYYISHKLKGSVSMFRSATLQDLLQKIEAGSRERKDTTALINSFINIYQHLEQQLVAEKTKVEALLRIQV
jgi:signal transduction histidine kinase/CheY-like chemotaxis protein